MKGAEGGRRKEGKKVRRLEGRKGMAYGDGWRRGWNVSDVIMISGREVSEGRKVGY
jgi:hypothetical protein